MGFKETDIFHHPETCYCVFVCAMWHDSVIPSGVGVSFGWGGSEITEG